MAVAQSATSVVCSNWSSLVGRGNVDIDWASWARSVEDHFRTHKLVREAGAKLVPITEPMIGEDTPESFFMEGMFASTTSTSR
jgi:hypothetical protein